MDAVFLARLQFGVTAGFHFLYPPLSIGLAWCLVVIETLAWRTGDPHWEAAGRFFSKVLALTFAVGVATGIVMEFQFGTNWSQYSRYVGDIFGAPLAAEALFAFFLESTFLGLYLFGRGRVSRSVTWFSVLMVAVGATISAFWIIAANSWQQTPAGFRINPVSGRAELTSFVEAVFNPSTLPRFFHTTVACLLCGSFLMAGVAAYRLRKGSALTADRRALAVSVIVGFIASILVAFPTGHVHAQQVAATQPEKFAALEGLYETQRGAPLVAFGLVRNNPPELRAKLHVPVEGMLSWLAFGDVHAEVKGINDFPEDERPPLWMTFVSFHNMVILGLLFQFILLLALVQWWRGRLWTSRRLLWCLMACVPLSLAACEFGWVAAEVGRQPWAVYRLLRTADAASPTITAGQVIFSLVMFTAIYTVLLVLYLFLLRREAGHGLETGHAH